MKKLFMICWGSIVSGTLIIFLNYFLLEGDVKLFIFGLFIVTMGFGLLIFNLSDKKQKFKYAELETIDEMDHSEFIEYTVMLLRKLNFNKIKIISENNYQGIDIIAMKKNKKFGFQCKRRKINVGVKSVQQIYAGKSFYQLDKAIILTNNYFTSSAKKLAKGLQIELWNRNYLEKLLEKLHEAEAKFLLKEKKQAMHQKSKNKRHKKTSSR